MKRKNNRKEEIYTVAANLFRKKGYSASSMRDIAELVGIEPSSLYSHIKSKEEILINICKGCARDFRDGMHVVNTSSKSVTEKIDTLIDLHIDVAFNQPTSITVFNDEWRHLPKNYLKEFLKDRSDYEIAFKSILKEGMQKGSIIPMSESTAFHIIINSVKWLHYFVKKISPSELEEVRKEIKTFIARGLHKLPN